MGGKYNYKKIIVSVTHATAMKIYYDASVDALYVEFRPLKPGTAETREISEDIVANYGPDGYYSKTNVDHCVTKDFT